MAARRAPHVGVVLVFVGLALWAPARAAASADPCGADALLDRLVSEGLPVSDLALTNPGATLVLTSAGRPVGGLWFGFLPDGELATTDRQVGLSSYGRSEVQSLFRGVIARLDEARDLRSCPSLSIPTFDAVAGQGHLESVLKPSGQPLTPAKGLSRSPLALAVHVLVALALLAYLGIVVVLIARALRRRPLDVAWAVGLGVGAFAIRVLLSARGPVEAANADFTHVVDVATWLRAGFDVYLGASYPPTYRVLLMGVFGTFGPVLEAGFLLTTAVGSLVAAPTYLLTLRLTGSRAAGVVAGLALAAYPPSIYFSNGLVLVTPAALLLTTAFAHLAALCDEGDGWDAAGYLLASFLLVQCRTEAAGIVALALVVHAAVLAQHGRLALALRRWWPGALLALAAAGPYVVLTAQATAATAFRDVASGLLVTALLRLAALAGGALLVSRLLERFPSLRLPLLGLASVLAWAWARQVVTGFSGDAFAPRPLLISEVPFVDFHSEAGPWTFGSFTRTASWQEPAFLPVLFGVLRWLALAPPATRRAGLPVMGVALVAMPLVGGELTSFISTGIAGVEGLRFHVPYAGLVAASVGVGAERVISWSGATGRSRGALLVVLVGLALSPLATHRALVTDTDRDQRAEYLFAREALSRLPDGATVVLPDARGDALDAAGTAAPTSDVFRTAHLLEAVAWSRGISVDIRGLRDVTPLEARAGGGAWLFRGLDCYRAPRPLAEEPECALARSIVTRPPVALRDVPTRVHSNLGLGAIGPSVREMRFELTRLEASEVAAIQSRLAPADAVRRSSGLTARPPHP